MFLQSENMLSVLYWHDPQMQKFECK